MYHRPGIGRAQSFFFKRYIFFCSGKRSGLFFYAGMRLVPSACQRSSDLGCYFQPGRLLSKKKNNSFRQLLVHSGIRVRIYTCPVSNFHAVTIWTKRATVICYHAHDAFKYAPRLLLSCPPSLPPIPASHSKMVELPLRLFVVRMVLFRLSPRIFQLLLWDSHSRKKNTYVSMYLCTKYIM